MVRRSHCLILALTLLAAGLRLWQLPAIPPGLEYDEAIKGFDALWMLETGQRYIFVNSVNGREALFLYPVALFLWLLGVTPFALRLAAVYSGILTVPLLYRLARTLFRNQPQRDWLALVAAAGLAVSLWHLGMSRIALRAILTPLFFTLIAWLFWQARQFHLSGHFRRGYLYFAAAGVALGLSGYTYISARLFPVVLAAAWLVVWLTRRWTRPARLAHWAAGLVVMALIALLVFTPMLLFIRQNADAFSRRAGQVAFPLEWTPAGLLALLQHLGQGFRLFLGGSDPRIRHHLIERPVFDGLTLLAFWIGVVIALRRWRQPVYPFLLLSVGLLWLPAPLSVDPIHSVRSAAMLPAFFMLVALGLIQTITWLGRRWSPLAGPARAGWLSLGLTVLLVGGVNAYDYFGRWAQHPLTYAEYKGPYLDLAGQAVELTKQADVILPYRFYAYGPVRFMLHDTFQESLGLSTLAGRNRPVVYLEWTGADLTSPYYVWLTRDGPGSGVAHLFHAGAGMSGGAANIVQGRRKNEIGLKRPVEAATGTQLIAQDEMITTSFSFDDHIRLGGYELSPPLIEAGRPGVLTLYWRGLQDEDLGYNLFIQILNERGEPVTQLEEPVFDNLTQYYENRPGFLIRSHLFWLGRETPPGLYLLRLGLFEPHTGQRLAISDGPPGDQIILAPFYLTGNGVDPRQPDYPHQARLGNNIEVLGYSLNRPLNEAAGGVEVKVYWRATGPISQDYTAFVQLLDAGHQVTGQWDSQPAGGLYPTSRWQPGQVVVSAFPLTWAGSLPAGDYRLVTGMYDLETGERLPAVGEQGQPLPAGMVTLMEMSVSRTD